MITLEPGDGNPIDYYVLIGKFEEPVGYVVKTEAGLHHFSPKIDTYVCMSAEFMVALGQKLQLLDATPTEAVH